jgi:hypothetical protein
MSIISSDIEFSAGSRFEGREFFERAERFPRALGFVLCNVLAFAIGRTPLDKNIDSSNLAQETQIP